MKGSTKVAEHRDSQFMVDTLYRLCEGLGFTMSEFFRENSENESNIA